MLASCADVPVSDFTCCVDAVSRTYELSCEDVHLMAENRATGMHSFCDAIRTPVQLSVFHTCSLSVAASESIYSCHVDACRVPPHENVQEYYGLGVRRMLEAGAGPLAGVADPSGLTTAVDKFRCLGIAVEWLPVDLRHCLLLRPLTNKCRTFIAREVAKGLQHLHAHGIVHGSFSSWCVKMDAPPSEARHVAITHCWNSILPRWVAASLRPRDVLFTTPFPAPDAERSTASDFWGFGILLWELLQSDDCPPVHGFRGFAEEHTPSASAATSETEATPTPCAPETVNTVRLPGNCPQSFAKLIKQCLHSDAAKRHVSWEVIAHHLHDVEMPEDVTCPGLNA